jgi:triacylglycerol lipase
MPSNMNSASIDSTGSRSDRNPVLLIHGITDTTIVFRTMSAYLSGLGWSVYSFNLIPNNGDLGLDELARRLTI